MNKYCFALDLKNDPDLIRKYKLHHEQVWPEVLEDIREAGIINMEIYHIGNRLFMIVTTNEESFSFESEGKQGELNPKVQEWEELMWEYQQAIPFAKPGEKWVKMDKIFDLKEQL